jgi:hypothetical protein
VLLHGGGRHEIEVGENTIRRKQRMDFAEQRALALIVQMVDRQSGDDHIERRENRQRLVEVVDHKLNSRVRRETLLGVYEHRLRGVDPHTLSTWMAGAHQREQPPVAGSEIEYPANLGRECFEQ